ncbi:hypothetical protein FB550_12354 [Neobacillus bataviensis]|uniref:Uncharacterized protein n=1 Tax=Neobacillus bataviensis TaxID=220685 RepID=A0A561CGR0_9BACI|nr:hypothetical protein FB550_12354 [Neobacillus bataviensis]
MVGVPTEKDKKAGEERPESQNKTQFVHDMQQG